MTSAAALKYYDWQEQVINHPGNVTIRGGRQIGKSESVAERIVYLAHKYPGSRHLIIAASERQENYLLEKVRFLLDKREGKKYKFRARATLTKLPLKNGTDIYKFPVGKTGIYIEGLSSVDFLYADEAIHIGRKVWDSILPMLAEPRKRGLGWITLLSTTRGKPTGFFFESFTRKDFLKVHIRSEDCPHISKEFLKEEKQRLGLRMFNIIYGGEFDEEAHKYFPSEVIERAIKISHWSMKKYRQDLTYYLGVDPARFGKAKAAFAVAEMEKKEKVNIVHGEQHPKTSFIFLREKCKELNSLFKFRTLFIDGGGIGGGLIDMLTEEFGEKKIRALDNKTATGKGKILKEDLYSNFLRMLELGQVQIINNQEVIDGLLAVEYDEEGKIRGSDMSEAIVRAAWCVKEKSIKPYIVTF